MRLAVHLTRLVIDTCRFSVAHRHVSLLIVVVISLLVAAIVVASQAVAPFALYPFL